MGRKRNGKFGLGATSGPTGDLATPHLVLVGPDAGIDLDPQVMTRKGIGLDPVGDTPNGFKVGFHADGFEPDPHQLGYLLWLHLGGQTIVDDEHVITPGDNLAYCKAFCDLDEDLTTGKPTETALGGMIGGLSIDIQKGAYVQCSIKGNACAPHIPTDPLERVLLDHPLSWSSLRAGDFKIGYNGGVLTSDRTIQGIKIDSSRKIDDEEGIGLDSTQPDELVAHGRTLNFELKRKFQGAQAIAEYNAWIAQQTVGISVEMKVDGGAQRVLLEILNGRPTGNYKDSIGQSDESIMGTLKVNAFVSGTDPLISAIVDDLITSNYS